MTGVSELELTQFSILDYGPLESLHPNTDGEQRRENNDGLHTNLFAFVMLGLSSPVKESGNVFGHLRSSGRSAFRQKSAHYVMWGA